MANKLVQFSNDAVGEFGKIHWPKLNAAMLTSAIVVVAAVMIGIIFTGLDQLISMLLLVIFRADV